MNWKLLRGYVLVIVSALILVAAAIILISNIRRDTTIQLFVGPRTLSASAWLLLAAAGGVVLWMTFTKLLPWSVSAFKAGAKQRNEKAAQQQLKQLADREKRQQR